MDKIIQRTKTGAIELLYQKDAVKIDLNKGFLLKGDIKSPVYFNLGVLECDACTRMDIASSLFILLSQKHDFDAIVGVVSGGISWASCIANSRMKPLIRVHSQPKQHGLYNQIEGVLPKNGAKILIMDDAITTGKNVLKVVEALRQGAYGKKAVEMEVCSIFDWHFPSVDQKFIAAGVKKYSLTSFSEVLDYGFENGLLPSTAKSAIEEFCAQNR